MAVLSSGSCLQVHGDGKDSTTEENHGNEEQSIEQYMWWSFLHTMGMDDDVLRQQ